MKKRVIFCFFLSIYLIYTLKDSLLIKIEELPYINFMFRVVVDMFANIYDYFSLNNPQVIGEELINIEKDCKINLKLIINLLYSFSITIL